MVYHVSRRIAVIYLGRVVELADREVYKTQMAHPYTKALFEAIPQVNFDDAGSTVPPLAGDLPSPVNLPSGCVFHTRCPYTQKRCKEEVPKLRDLGGRHYVACHLV